MNSSGLAKLDYYYYRFQRTKNKLYHDLFFLYATTEMGWSMAEASLWWGQMKD